MVNKMRLVVAVTIVGGLLTAMFSTGVVAAPFKVAVAESGLSYSPKTAHVNKGRKVKWTNGGGISHTVTFYKKPKRAKVKSFTLSPGASKKRKLTKRGVYKYRCTVATHSSVSNGKCTGMCGKVRVH